MLKAKCEWKTGAVTSFRWTRDDALLAPPSAHPDLDLELLQRTGELRMSPVFPLATSTGVKRAGLATSLRLDASGAKSFCVQVDSLDDVDWSEFTTSIWIEAADGSQIGMKDQNGKRELSRPIAGFRFFADEHPPPYVVHCELRSFGNLFGDTLTREIPVTAPVDGEEPHRLRVPFDPFRSTEPSVGCKLGVFEVFGAKHKMKLRFHNLKHMFHGHAFTINVLNEGVLDERPLVNARRWIENQKGEKSFVLEQINPYFDDEERCLFGWAGPRKSLVRFANGADLVLCCDFNRCEKQTAAVKAQTVKPKPTVPVKPKVKAGVKPKVVESEDAKANGKKPKQVKPKDEKPHLNGDVGGEQTDESAARYSHLMLRMWDE
ncbi:hypothetical protein M3Y99_00677700 [Aphelenchoides fujianensis]|nr:hypothetical protein M3Y99_00677700 [Aphelenchoides fujianensis]